MKITIPTEPVDQYEVIVWTLSMDYEPERRRYVYHVNTPWERYMPDDPRHGAAIVDDWMVYERFSEHACGRICGWMTLPKGIARADGLYPTFADAKTASIARLQQRLARLESEIAVARERLRSTIEMQEPTS